MIEKRINDEMFHLKTAVEIRERGMINGIEIVAISDGLRMKLEV